MKKVLLILPLLLLSGCFEEPILDEKADLIWEGGVQFDVQYMYAKEYCENLSQGGFDNWRLPSVEELNTLKNSNILKGTDKILSTYWSSDINENNEIRLVGFGFKEYFKKGKLIPENQWVSKTTDYNYAKCVKSNFSGYLHH